MKAKMLFLLLNAVLVSLFCGGCWGGRTPSAQYYRLADLPQPAAVSAALPELASLRVELPDYLCRQEIVETRGENLMYMKPEARWGHSLADGIRDSLICRMERLNECPPGKSRDAVRLDYRFWKFSGDRDGHLQVRGICRGVLLNSGRKNRRMFDFSVPYDVTSTASLVAAHDQAVTRIMKETADWLKNWPEASEKQ